jgi:hypothetical protein
MSKLKELQKINDNLENLIKVNFMMFSAILNEINSDTVHYDENVTSVYLTAASKIALKEEMKNEM